VEFAASGKPTAQEVDDLIVLAEDVVDNDFSSPDALKSWKEHTETDRYYEYDGYGTLYLGRQNVRAQAGYYVTDGKIYYFDGTDFSSYWEEGDDKDFFVDHECGVVYFSTMVGDWMTRDHKNVKLGFKWGASSVPNYIKIATAIRTALLIATNDDYADVFTSSDGRVQTSFKVQQFRKIYEELLENHREVP